MQSEWKKLIEKQEKEFEKEFKDVLLCDENFDRAIKFIAKMRKELMNYYYD